VGKKEMKKFPDFAIIKELQFRMRNSTFTSFRPHAELRRRGGAEAGLAAMDMRKLPKTIRTPK
jgi:hypothetical protein